MQVNAFPSDGKDFTGSAEFNFLFTFDSVTTTIEIPVTIFDNSVFELTEFFDATLSFPGAPVPRVTLDPDSAQTTVFDDDG